jgi:hypothetical protein
MKLHPLLFVFALLLIIVLAAAIMEKRLDQQFELDMAKAGMCKQLVEGAWNVRHPTWQPCKK